MVRGVDCTIRAINKCSPLDWVVDYASRILRRTIALLIPICVNVTTNSCVDILDSSLKHSFSTLLAHSELSIIKANVICVHLHQSILSDRIAIPVEVLVNINPAVFVNFISINHTIYTRPILWMCQAFSLVHPNTLTIRDLRIPAGGAQAP